MSKLSICCLVAVLLVGSSLQEILHAEDYDSTQEITKEFFRGRRHAPLPVQFRGNPLINSLRQRRQEPTPDDIPSGLRQKRQEPDPEDAPTDALRYKRQEPAPEDAPTDGLRYKRQEPAPEDAPTDSLRAKRQVSTQDGDFNDNGDDEGDFDNDLDDEESPPPPPPHPGHPHHHGRFGHGRWGNDDVEDGSGDRRHYGHGPRGPPNGGRGRQDGDGSRGCYGRSAKKRRPSGRKATTAAPTTTTLVSPEDP